MRTASAAALALAVAAGFVAPASGQELRMTVDRASFFEDDPAWMFGMRLALGVAPDEDALYPEVGLLFGRAFAEHFYLAGVVDGRLTGQEHVRGRLRFSAYFAIERFTLSIDTDLGVMGIPRTHELGPTVTWSLGARYRLSTHHALTLDAGVDLLFEAVGFRHDRVLVTTGLGWMVLF